ncbi:SET and MYND domain-containing protein 4-like isoform X2 [Hylaeus anthracinus]|uniref:SET and MYND domain-containing protein 4-like isoform X2 n=1 Tax=Hylaeus anthracinus TaxID=313031 RepID=UPI0023B895DA|nr:SET and MYND domain-containing protein 4-like isoform X2 [Hylaeus anthracinus]
MECSEERYRTLCSLETVRSGKKGFFRDFSEHVSSVAGEAWIAKVFGRLTDDESRIRALFTDQKIKTAVLDTLSRTKTLYRAKDANASKARRLEGFVAAAAADREKALLLFSQAVLRAPVPEKCEKSVDAGLALPLALLGRAETFLASNEHVLALEDLALLEEIELPEQLRKELARKKEECERFLRANEKSLITVKEHSQREKVARVPETKPPGSLTGGENPLLPGASALLEIEETARAGKRAIAAKEIGPGDTLVIEPPLAACLLPEYFGTHCHHCFSRLRNPIGCPDCSSVAFCGRACRDTALATYHRYECKILALAIGSGMSALSMLALRMVTGNGPSKCAEIYESLRRGNRESEGAAKSSLNDRAETEPWTKPSRSAKRRIRKKKLRDSRYRDREATEIEEQRESRVDLRAYDLVSHENERTPTDLFERSLMAAFLLKCLQRVEFFEKPAKDDAPPGEREIGVAVLLLKHLQLLQFNAHEVFETRLGPEHRFRGSRPIYLGVAIYPTVARFNHDCYPAVTRYFVGRCIVIRAIRSLKPGEVVAENYGPIFTKRNLDERRRTLAGRYWFRCECTACREDWPSFETLTNDRVKLRCPTEGCEKLHRLPRDPSRAVECSSCRRKVDLFESVQGLRACEDLYGRGFAAMDEEQPERALEAFFEVARMFHRIAVPPHKDTHLAEIAASACMANAGNVWRQIPLSNPNRTQTRTSSS